MRGAEGGGGGRCGHCSNDSGGVDNWESMGLLGEAQIELRLAALSCYDVMQGAG